MGRSKILKTTRTEAEVLVAVLDAAKAIGIDLDRQNTGAAQLPGKGGKEQTVRFGKRGNADLSGMLDRGPNAGKKLDVEVKHEGYDPSKLRGDKKVHFDRQLARLQKTNAQGGIGFWTDDAVEFMEIMQHVLAGARVEETGYGRPIVYYPGSRPIDDDAGRN